MIRAGTVVLAALALVSVARVAVAGIWNEAPFRGLSGLRVAGARDSAATAVLFLSVANPYSIEGLAASALAMEIESRVFVVGLEWRTLSHALYREDLLSSAAAFPTPVRGVSAGVECALASRRAEGFPAERSCRLRLLATAARADAISLRFAAPLAEGGKAPRERPSWSCDARVGTFGAGISRFSPDGIAMEWRIDAIVPIGGRANIRSSYAVRSADLSIGVLVEIRRVIIGISWDVNPSLGTGVSVGVGRRWKR